MIAELCSDSRLWARLHIFMFRATIYYFWQKSETCNVLNNCIKITPRVLRCHFQMSGKEPTKKQAGEQGGVLDSVKEAGKSVSDEISKKTGGSQVLRYPATAFSR